MADVTDHVFREIISDIGKPDVLYTEFVSTDALESEGRNAMLPKLKYDQRQKPIVAQIWGTKPEHFYQASKLIENYGFDGIDLNTGCPDKNVMKIGSGAALINNHLLVKDIVNAMKKGAPNTPISIKTRLAKNDTLTLDWFKFLLELPVQAIILHARTASQLSKVPANWSKLKELVKLKNQVNPNIQIIGNGDIRSLKEVNEKYAETGVDGIMIGRGIFNNPWLFNKNKLNKTPKDNIELLIKHTTLYNNIWGTSKNFEVMKKFFKIYVKEWDGASELRANLSKIKKYSDFTNVMNEYLKNNPELL